ncbi:hydantoinase/oxoprolinase family protein [Pseudolabrys sp. FHR47]|uniref:hydantoinase/oxoprolinase family protein n=1 Tax=Pseudolabrys sp. FHR47 TaxID=2562284 RepID=UPI0010BF11D2|nr:hydantoinase/oxoprolinase family protein [Pseudolabrys sp. FHR47]
MTNREEMQPRLRLAADIGGTFTDVAAFDQTNKRLLLGKSLSTPRAMVEGIEAGVGKAGTAFSEAGLFLHGSTVAINTMLERTGARTVLITTRGFRDVYEIGRINRPDAYNLFFQKHAPLIAREYCYEVTERLYADGRVFKPLDETELEALADVLAREKIEAVAILFLHCYRNPAHELRAKEILQRRLPGVFISASHELSQEYREFERCSTVVANAFIGPRVQRYLTEIGQRIKGEGFKGNFLVVQSTGGLFELDKARTECIRILESGPASGVIGTQAMCHALGMDNAIAFDMGGTTAKAGVILNGRALTTGQALIGSYDRALPIQVATIDIFEVGTGGGSIARVEHGGALHVGPRSAGAEPGPACYGRGGTEPTITDANLLLGRLGADRFLGGEMKLDVAAAEKAMADRVATPLGLSTTDAANGILRIAATKMSYAVKGVTTERGLDAGSFALVAYGGAGPLHATAVARELGIRTVIIPRAPGHFSAFGMLFSDLRYDFVRTWFISLEQLDFAALEATFAEFEAEGRAAIDASAIAPQEVTVRRALDMRYVGQEHSVTVDVPQELFDAGDRAAIKALFDAVHLQRYGTSAPSERAEIASLRTTVTGVVEKPGLEKIAAGTAVPPKEAHTGTRRAYFEEVGFVETPTFARAALLAGNRAEGPALIEEHASTTVVLPGDIVEVDALGNLLITVFGARS